MARYPYREIIELYSTGVSIEKVAYLCGTGFTKAWSVLKEAKRLGIGWPVPAELGDDELERLVDPIEHTRRFEPDFPAIARTLGVKRLKPKFAERAYEVYLQMVRDEAERLRKIAEEEAEKAADEAGALVESGEHGAFVAVGGLQKPTWSGFAVKKPYAFTTFRELMGKWNALPKLKPSMRVNWFAGEEVQVDWAGKTLQLFGADGKVAPAFLFVGTLPYSDITFVRASLDMGMLTWLEHHVRMFGYFGGVPIFIGIDNLATGVTFHEDGTRTVNEQYRDLAEHYGAIVVPTRVSTPTDKGGVEGHVKIMANSIVGILEGMRFESIDQLNDAIAVLLEVFNDRPSSALQSLSRREAFEAWEREALQPLPEEPYAPMIWKKYDVARDSVVTVRGNHYGMPKGFEGQTVWVRVSKTRVDVYDSRKAQCLASHPRRMDGADTFEGLPGTCPDRFRPLVDWASANGRLFLLLQWDAERNTDISLDRIVCRSKKVVWWHCPTCGYTWQEAVVGRTEKTFDDCPMCAGLVLVEGVNDLATTHPEIAAEWDVERNPLPANKAFPDWRQSVWWKGACGHSWCASVMRRTSSAKGALCPYCSGEKALAGFNDVATLAPEMAAMWHPSRNRNIGPESVSVYSDRSVYLWDGVFGESWHESPRKWLERHGMHDVLAPFAEVVERAKMMDEAGGDNDGMDNNELDDGAGTAKSDDGLDNGDWTAKTDQVGFCRGAGACSAMTVGCKNRPGRSLQYDRARDTVKWRLFNKVNGLSGLSLRRWCERFGHPELIEQWDVERNEPLTPDDVTYCDTQKVWWTDEGCGHSWQTTVRTRTYNDIGCLYCERYRVLSGYTALDGTSATSVKNWDAELNGPMTPATVTDRTNGMAWWRCPECGHEWSESLNTNGDAAHACPVCAKRPYHLKPGVNDLVGTLPQVAKLFAEDLNEGIDVKTIFAASKKRYWWRCELGHTWYGRVDTQAKFKTKERCPYCAGRRLLTGFNDLATLVPEAAALWNTERNEKTASEVTAGTQTYCWWKCTCGHEWRATVRDVAIRGTRCPRCANRAVVAGDNDLATLAPELAAQWHPTKNGGLKPTEVALRSNKRVWWQCSEGHSWEAMIHDRVRCDAGCPVCTGRLLVPGVNDLATTHPELAAQWDSELNGDLKPTQVTRISNKYVWWRCKLGHAWQLHVRRRVIHDAGCPYCNNRKLLPGFNDLATLRPDMAAQWYYEGNWPLKPEDVMPTYTKKVWWQTDCGHVFQLTVNQRSKNIYLTCPYCSGHKQIESPLHAGDVKPKTPAPLALNATPKPRPLSWGRKVLEEFLTDPRKTIYAEFETRQIAHVKRESLGKELRAEGNPYVDKIKVELQGTKIYLQKLE